LIIGDDEQVVKGKLPYLKITDNLLCPANNENSLDTILHIRKKYVSMYTNILTLGGEEVDARPNDFGEYLKRLIKDAGMTQTDFYTKLGIKKPYFYDILSGRVNPPPPPLQFKAMDVFKADEETRTTFFDLAAQGRGELPADIVLLAGKNPAFISNIRRNLNQLLTTQR